MTRNQISALSPQERVAGYLVHSAKLAELGARLRTKYKDVSDDYNEGWNAEEEDEWDRHADELEKWFYELTQDEIHVVKYVEKVLSPLTRAEWPIEIEKVI